MAKDYIHTYIHTYIHSFLQISVPVQYDKPAFDEIQSQSNTEKELLISADNTSLLMSDVNFISDENGPDLQHTNSTPVVKMRPLTANGSGKENNTDLSTLSSISCDLNGEHEVSDTLGKATAGGLEDELKHEFESKLPRHGRRSRNRNRTRDRREQHQSDVLGKRNLVVGARGNSQTDLAGSAGGSGERRDTGGVEQHEGMDILLERFDLFRILLQRSENLKLVSLGSFMSYRMKSEYDPVFM